MSTPTEPVSSSDSARPIPALQNVQIELDEGIAWVTLNRPEKRNCISPGLSADMNVALDFLESDRRCGVMVLTGAGDAYCAGMDLREFFRATDALSIEARAPFFRANLWQTARLMSFIKPTIAMVNGWCFGAGFNSLVACDLAIAAEEASFGLSEINWGIMPAGNVLKSCSAVMSQRDILLYAMTGRAFDGRQAAEMKLVNEAVPLAELRATTRDLAIELVGKNPTALRAIKLSARRVKDMSWDDSGDYLLAKSDQMIFQDPEKGRAKGMSQFLDDKTYRPGLGSYKRD
jgi:trans-feruloyl-CoA hydratase/vanillin synthase